MRYLFAIALSLMCSTALVGQARRVDDAALKNTGKSASDGDWLTYGLTPGETRFSPLKQIDVSNVNRLGLVWSYEVGDGGGDQEATPLVWNNTIFGVTNWSIVFAVDARTGKEKWRWDPEVNRKATGDRLCCGVVNRGLALYDNKIYVPVNDGRLEALDAATGKPVWEARVAYPQNDQTLTIAPRIAKGKVIVGAAGADRPTRGFFAAYDAQTGREIWRFWTVPGDPAKGFESSAMRKAAATWDGEWWKLGGGGSVWDGISYDPDNGLLYVGTGNAEPWPEALRTKDVSTGHDNLYVASIVAVHVDTGELKWHYQMVPGDEWDYDSVQQMILADLNIDGKTRKVIMQANKNGFFYVLDRITGEFISAQPFSRVTWAKGIDQKTGRPLINAEVKYGKELVPVSPGGGGAHNWSPMSFNPQTGLVYIPTRGWDTFNYSVNYDFNPETARGVGLTGLNMNTNGLQKKPAGPAIGPEPLEGGNLSTLVAYDPVKQEISWRVPVGNSRYGGTLSTASNLVFQVAPDGRLIAYSADKGQKLFELATGMRFGMGPPITFLVDGKQYIALMGGNGGTQSPGQTGPGGGSPHAAEASAARFWTRRQSRIAQARLRARASIGGSTSTVDSNYPA
ncbi:MAG TPA: PQQ-dependent dehydrogenase, methanol/ethanol family [Bryobacteraceae bacterium]